MCSTCSTSAALLGWEGAQLTACSASMRRAKQTKRKWVIQREIICPMLCALLLIQTATLSALLLHIPFCSCQQIPQSSSMTQKHAL